VHYSKRRRYSPSDSRQDNRHNRQSVEDTAPGEVSPARMASTEANEATDHTAAALEAATAEIDAAAVVSETAVAGGADSPPEAHPAAASAPEAEGDEAVSHVANTAQIVDTADHKRSHRKYRKREGTLCRHQAVKITSLVCQWLSAFCRKFWHQLSKTSVLINTAHVTLFQYGQSARVL
jgi:hypothetical protein